MNSPKLAFGSPIHFSKLVYSVGSSVNQASIYASDLMCCVEVHFCVMKQTFNLFSMSKCMLLILLINVIDLIVKDTFMYTSLFGELLQSFSPFKPVPVSSR